MRWIGLVVALSVLGVACADDRDTPHGSRRLPVTDAESADSSARPPTSDQAADGPGGSPAATTAAVAGRPTTTPIDGSPTTTQPAPTTIVPTTIVPTTIVPTTIVPTTIVPTTIVPTTIVPTTAVPTDLDTTSARAALDALTRSPDVVDGYLELPTCPLDPSGATLTELVSDLDAPPIALAVGGETIAGVYSIEADPALEVSCDRAHGDRDANGIGLFAMPPPNDYAAFSNSIANPEGDPAIIVTVDPSASDRGGRYVRTCVADADEPEFDYCEVVWIGADLLVGAYVAGVGSGDVDLGDFEAALAEHLATIVVALGD